jgi:hypothetical protein
MMKESHYTSKYSPYLAPDNKSMFHRVQLFSDEDVTKLNILGVFYEGKRIYLLFNQPQTGEIYSAIFHLEEKKIVHFENIGVNTVDVIPKIESAVVFFATESATSWYLQTASQISILEWTRKNNKHNYTFLEKKVGYANITTEAATMITYNRYPLICNGVQDGYKHLKGFSYLGSYAHSWVKNVLLYERRNPLLILQKDYLYIFGGNTKFSDPFMEWLILLTPYSSARLYGSEQIYAAWKQYAMFPTVNYGELTDLNNKVASAVNHHLFIHIFSFESFAGNHFIYKYDTYAEEWIKYTIRAFLPQDGLRNKSAINSIKAINADNVIYIFLSGVLDKNFQLEVFEYHPK